MVPLTRRPPPRPPLPAAKIRHDHPFAALAALTSGTRAVR